jgi:hypothetical protein
MKYIAICVFFFMTACTTTPPVPQTPRQMLLAAYETLDTYVDAIKSAQASNLITGEQKTTLLARANNAYAYLEDARQFLDGMPPSELLCGNATSCLQVAQKVLTEIQNDLPKEQPK